MLTGQAAATNAGPAIVLSFVIAGFVASLAALCYSEMACMFPVAGSAYSYTYATMGELVAWIIGWDLILEYLVGAAAVSVGWSGYLCSFLGTFSGFKNNTHWTAAPFLYDSITGRFELTGSYVNLPAVVIVAVITTLLVTGIRESSRVNAAAVVTKLTVILAFLCFAIKYVSPSHWQPFIPPNTGTFGHFGWSGVFQGATIVFFSYIGFDCVSTAALECKNPQRDLPIGICASLGISTLLYLLVSGLLTGMVSYTQLNVANPISIAIEATGVKWMVIVIDIGALCGLTSVLLVLLMGQPRIFFSMSKDGLLPPIFSRIHPHFKTPYVSTILSGTLSAILGGLLPISVLAELTSIGTLLAFFLVCMAVMILRHTRPDAKRKFKVPFGPYFIPLLGAASSLGLICTATVSSIIRLAIWMVIGLVVYFSYGRRYSVLNKPPTTPMETIVLDSL